MLWSCKKNVGTFSRCFCPLNWPFFRGGAFSQNWGAGPSILGQGSFTNAFSLAPSSDRGALPVSFPKWGAGPSIMSWTLNYELALSTTVAAAPGVLSQPGPSILGRAPQFWESVGAPKKWPIWGGKFFFWTPQKKFHRGNGRDMCFLQKNWKKSVKFGLGGRSNISLPHIGGSHPVPSLSLLSTERRGTAMY